MLRRTGSSSSISSMARTFGAPVSVPAGKVAVSTSNAAMTSATFDSTVDTMCHTWLYRSTAPNSTTCTEPGADTRPRSLRARSTSMTCSACSFGSLTNSAASAASRSAVSPRRLVPAIGCSTARPSLTVARASGLQPTMSTSSVRRKYMYGEGFSVRRTRYTSSGSASVSATNRWPTWIWKTSPARTASSACSTAGRYCPAGVRDTAAFGAAVPMVATVGSAGGVRRPPRFGRRRTEGGDRRLRGGGERRLHGVEPALRAGVRVVQLDGRHVRAQQRVRDQHHRALVVVDGGEVGDEQHGELRQSQLVDRLVRQPLDAAYHVIAEVADQAAGQRRQLRQSWTLHRPPRRPQGGQWVADRRQPGRDLADPGGRAVHHGQRRRRVDPDERPARERRARLGRLEEERPGPSCGELAVHADRRLGVCAQRARDRHQPVGLRQPVEVGPAERPAHRPVTASSPPSKHVRAPVWHAGPIWSTLTSSASPSQSSATDFTYCG